MTKKTITQDDKDLFRQSVGDVKTIKTDITHLDSPKTPAPEPESRPIDYDEHLDRSNDSTKENLGLGDSMAFIAPGLQKNVLKKMRKGHYGIDAELDLHGLNRTEAEQQLLKFLYACSQNGYRCVHIIHGKGYRSPDNQPILKNSMNQWLRQHRDVLAFCSANPKDGGTGAVYVLLRVADKYRKQ